MSEQELDPDDLILIEALAAGQNHNDAGQAIGRSAKTVQRKLTNPRFAAALQQRKAQRLDELTNRLASIAAQALDALDEMLTSENEQVRLAATRLAFTGHLKYRAAHEVETRLKALEADLAQVSRQHSGTK